MPALRLTGRIDGLDVAEVMKAAGSAGRHHRPPRRHPSRLAGTGTDAEALLRTARGSIAAAITNGTMPRLELVRPIVLAFGKPSGAPPEGSGSAFSRLGGTFALAEWHRQVRRHDDGVARFRPDRPRHAWTWPAARSRRAATWCCRSELTAQAGVDLRRYAQEDGRVVVPGNDRRHAAAADGDRSTSPPPRAARSATRSSAARRSFLDGLFRRRKK